MLIYEVKFKELLVLTKETSNARENIENREETLYAT